jgi:hypothetical protein
VGRSLGAARDVARGSLRGDVIELLSHSVLHVVYCAFCARTSGADASRVSNETTRRSMDDDYGIYGLADPLTRMLSPGCHLCTICAGCG